MFGVGFRSHLVIEDATTGELDSHGAYAYVEVTAATATKFYPNPVLPSGAPNPASQGGIPIAAGQTRPIPMVVYNFKADAAVTVVAYRS